MCTHSGCSKTFYYPKDLRRHLKVHDQRIGGIAEEEGLYADDVFTDASVGSFSRPSSMIASHGTSFSGASSILASNTGASPHLLGFMCSESFAGVRRGYEDASDACPTSQNSTSFDKQPLGLMPEWSLPSGDGHVRREDEGNELMYPLELAMNEDGTGEADYDMW